MQNTVMEPDQTRIAELRNRLAKLEGRLPSSAQLVQAPASAATKQGPASLSGSFVAPSAHQLVFGVEQMDALFAHGGMPIGSLHEFYGAQARVSGALSGFVAAMASQLLKQRGGKILWITNETVLREVGGPYAPGLAYFGIEPANVILVCPKREEDVLWAMEEGAQCGGIGVVIGETLGELKGLDLTATRRLVLRAEKGARPVFLVRHSGQPAPSAAVTRWQVMPGTSASTGDLKGIRRLVGAPRWTVHLEKNREGRPGHCHLEWSHVRNAFVRATENIMPMVQSPSRRQHLPQGLGQVVALPNIGAATRRLRQAQERAALGQRE